MHNECGHEWPYSLRRQRQLLAAGVSQAVIDSSVHVCVLEAGHGDTDHLCDCGEAS